MIYRMKALKTRLPSLTFRCGTSIWFSVDRLFLADEKQDQLGKTSLFVFIFQKKKKKSFDLNV